MSEILKSKAIESFNAGCYCFTKQALFLRCCLTTSDPSCFYPGKIADEHLSNLNLSSFTFFRNWTGPLTSF